MPVFIFIIIIIIIMHNGFKKLSSCTLTSTLKFYRRNNSKVKYTVLRCTMQNYHVTGTSYSLELAESIQCMI